jgi:mRNA degradation ribonuclease J1/J2
VISLDPNALRIVDHTVSGHVHVARGRDVPDEVLADRSRLAEQGALAVSIALDHHGRVVGSPDVHARGVLFTNQHSEWLAQLRLTVKRAVRIAVDDGLLGDLEELRESVRRKLLRFTYESLGRRVVCLVLVHVVQA